MARTRVEQQLNKPFLGKPYLKYAQCYALWAYCFQLGGILGAKHSANMDAFGPAFLALEGEPGAVERFFTAAANRLVKPSLNDSMTFADFVVAEFTGRVGYSGDAASFRFNHGMKKIKPETATELAWQYAELGAALGAIYPHVVRRMFDLTYAAVPKHAWKLAHASGLDIPPVQGVISYEEAEEGEDEVFMAYCLECCPELQAILKADYQEDHEGLLDVPNTARAEDEGIREKMLAYRRAINDVIDIDNILLSTCRHMFFGRLRAKRIARLCIR